jgi:hypothetical protein
VALFWFNDSTDLVPVSAEQAVTSAKPKAPMSPTNVLEKNFIKKLLCTVNIGCKKCCGGSISFVVKPILGAGQGL